MQHMFNLFTSYGSLACNFVLLTTEHVIQCALQTHQCKWTEWDFQQLTLK